MVCVRPERKSSSRNARKKGALGALFGGLIFEWLQLSGLSKKSLLAPLTWLGGV